MPRVGPLTATRWACQRSKVLGDASRNCRRGVGSSPLSALSNGSLGWLQIANFLVCGALTVLGAVGLREAMRGTPGGTWTPRLVAVNGLVVTVSVNGTQVWINPSSGNLIDTS